MRNRNRYGGILILLCLMGALLFCSACAPKEKIFTKSGMSITLTDAFTEGKFYSMTAYYESEDNTVSAIREPFSVLEENGVSTDLTLEEYAKTFIEDNEIGSEVFTEDGLTYFTYEKTIDDVCYLYFETVFRSEDSYWLFQFTCPKDAYGEMKTEFVKWAKSVRFS